MVKKKITSKIQSTHFDSKGSAKMVDVSHKKITTRVASAESIIAMKKDTLKMIIEGDHKKGDVLAVARIAGILGAKKTSDLIPLCHPIGIERIEINYKFNKNNNTVNEKKTDRQNKICHNVAPSKDLTIKPPKLKLTAPKKIKKGPGRFLIKFIIFEKLSFEFPIHTI